MENIDSWHRLLFMERIYIAVQDTTPVCKALQNIAMLFLDAMVPCHTLVLRGTSTFLIVGMHMVEILTEDKYQQTYNISATIPVQ